MCRCSRSHQPWITINGAKRRAGTISGSSAWILYTYTWLSIQPKDQAINFWSQSMMWKRRSYRLITSLSSSTLGNLICLCPINISKCTKSSLVNRPSNLEIHIKTVRRTWISRAIQVILNRSIFKTQISPRMPGTNSCLILTQKLRLSRKTSIKTRWKGKRRYRRNHLKTMKRPKVSWHSWSL